MKILFLTDNFPPEVNAPATRTYEHCKEWVKQGEEVTVITCTPNFPQGKVYTGYRNRLRRRICYRRAHVGHGYGRSYSGCRQHRGLHRQS